MSAPFLVAIPTCRERVYPFKSTSDSINGVNQNLKWIRQSWLPDAQKAGIDVRFFFGSGGSNGLPDEVELDVPDDYAGLFFKTQKMIQWALDHGYKHIVKIDDDVCLFADKFLAWWKPHQYAARTTYSDEHGIWGSGYCLCMDERSMQLIASDQTPESERRYFMRCGIPEDREIARILGTHGIACTNVDEQIFRISLANYVHSWGFEYCVLIHVIPTQKWLFNMAFPKYAWEGVVVPRHILSNNWGHKR